MATTESWVLDGLTLTGGTLDILELNIDPPTDRAEYITAADSEWGALAAVPKHENRKITMRLRVLPQASMNAALDVVGSVRDKLRKATLTDDGVALVWTPANSTRTVTFDVLNGQIPELPVGTSDQARSWFQQRPIFTLELTCKPYARGTEALTSTASSSTPLVTLEVANVPGDVPALGRLIVTDTASQTRRHVEWGLESRYYNSATSLLIDSDSMTTSGFAGAQTTGSGYDPNATGSNVVRATLYSTPLTVCSTGDQSHIGRFRVKARISPSATPVYARLAWQVGDGPWSRNPWDSIETITGFNELDLGLIHIPPVAAGTQRWRGQIEMWSTVDGTTADIDYLILIPADEGYGKARGAYLAQPGVLNGYDRFKNTTAGGTLNARVATVGGTWSSTGATTDFVFADNWPATSGDAESVTRTTGAVDTGIGRTALLPTSFTDTEVGVAVTYDEVTGTFNDDLQMGVVSRYVDSSNYLRTALTFDTTARIFKFETRLFAVGSTVYVRSIDVQGSAARTVVVPLAFGYRIVNIVYATGRFYSALYTMEGGLIVDMSGQDSRLATGGTHATGLRGFIDRLGTAGSTTRRFYGDFYAAVPAPEPVVVYSGRNMQVRDDDTVRQDSTGTYTGRPQSYNGTRFLVPPGTSRVAVKARRLDVDVDQDLNVTDATQIQIAYTPRFLVVPRV